MFSRSSLVRQIYGIVNENTITKFIGDMRSTRHEN